MFLFLLPMKALIDIGILFDRQTKATLSDHPAVQRFIIVAGSGTTPLKLGVVNLNVMSVRHQGYQVKYCNSCIHCLILCQEVIIITLALIKYLGRIPARSITLLLI